MAGNSYFERIPATVRKAHRILGILQITVGCATIALTILGLATLRFYTSVGSGLWAGPFFIVAGVCGLIAGRGSCNTLCCVVTCLVFSIIAACLGLSAMVLESIVASFNKADFDFDFDQSLWRATYAANILCSLLFAFEFVLAIVHCVYACRASCCCVSSTAPAASPPAGQQQQRVFVTTSYPAYPTAQPTPRQHHQPQPQPAFNPEMPPSYDEAMRDLPAA